jgi:hypothetical protein
MNSAGNALADPLLGECDSGTVPNQFIIPQLLGGAAAARKARFLLSAEDRAIVRQ